MLKTIRFQEKVTVLTRMYLIGFGGGPPVDNTPGPESDTVFVQGLGQDITKEKIAEKFGTIGVIKVKYSVLSILHQFFLSCRIT